LRVALDGGAGEIVTAREHIAGPARQPRRARTATPATGANGARGSNSKTREQDEAAARGEIAAKPDVTSHANHHYQKAVRLPS